MTHTETLQVIIESCRKSIVEGQMRADALRPLVTVRGGAYVADAAYAAWNLAHDPYHCLAAVRVLLAEREIVPDAN